jgi:hypothetical protein
MVRNLLAFSGTIELTVIIATPLFFNGNCAVRSIYPQNDIPGFCVQQASSSNTVPSSRPIHFSTSSTYSSCTTYSSKATTASVAIVTSSRSTKSSSKPSSVSSGLHTSISTSYSTTDSSDGDGSSGWSWWKSGNSSTTQPW